MNPDSLTITTSFSQLLKSMSQPEPELKPRVIVDLLRQLRENPDQIDSCLSDTGPQGFLTLANGLHQQFLNGSGPGKNGLRDALLLLLDLAREPVLQKAIYADDLVDAWFEAILAIVRSLNFRIGDLFQQRLSRHPGKTLFSIIHRDKVEEISWDRADGRIREIAKALLASLDKESQSCRVAILSENRIEGALVDLACLTHGIVNVPIPANSLEEQVFYILEKTCVELVFVSNREQLTKVLNKKKELPDLQYIVVFDADHLSSNKRLLSLPEFLERGKKTSNRQLEGAAASPALDDLATIMFTSGTTQAPKGICFSHLNLISKRFARAMALPEVGEDDVFLCYLPLFHTFGRYFEMLGCVFWGCTYVFAENAKIQTLLKNFKIARPSVFISIPKKWMEIYEHAGEMFDLEKESQEEISAGLCQSLGGRLRWGVSAAGHLDPDIFRFFQRHGIELMSGFGMTEATGGITMTPPGRYETNSVGKALPGIEIKLAEDNEMLIRGPYVMTGYHDEPPGNDADPGWLHTGDIFSRDEQGFYWILDRKKDIYKNVRGETVAPQKIENLFLDFDSVKQVFLVGDHRPYNTLLIVPNYGYEQVDLNKHNAGELRDFFQSHVVWVNRFLAPYERIVEFCVIERDFQKELGELTEKGTFRRKTVEKNFRDIIERMYETDHAKLHIGDIELRFPNWFLRKKGLTSSDIRYENQQISMTRGTSPLSASLEYEGGEAILRLGSYYYILKEAEVDFDAILASPSLWFGNLEIQEFAGEEAFRWVKPSEPPYSALELKGTDPNTNPTVGQVRKCIQAFRRKEITLPGIHFSAFSIRSASDIIASRGLDYLTAILRDTHPFKDQAIWALSLAARNPSPEIKRQAFLTLLEFVPSTDLICILKMFLSPFCDFVNERTIKKFAELDLASEQLAPLYGLSHDYQERARGELSDRLRACIRSLLGLLTAYGIAHPTKFKPIRAELVKWRCLDCDVDLNDSAWQELSQLVNSFRAWLGPNQKLAVDPETTKEYRWADVIAMEENLPPDSKSQIFNALQDNPIIQEALFLLCGGSVVRLQDIMHKGVWISALSEEADRSLYRVSVQTRFHGARDFVLGVNHTIGSQTPSEELDWLITARDDTGLVPLVKDFGGFWPELGLWTEEYIAGETIERALRRLNKTVDESTVTRIRHFWANASWSGACAYLDFWNRTQRRYTIQDRLIDNVIVPTYDFQIGYRIVSIAKKVKTDKLETVFTTLRASIEKIEAEFPKIREASHWATIFSAFVEVQPGQNAIGELENLRDRIDASAHQEISNALRAFLREVGDSGFQPRRLFFAIKRFHRWLELNPTATRQAKMQTLDELYNTYALANLESRYPGIRIQLFRDTIFKDNEDSLRNDLSQIVRDGREQGLPEESMLDLISELRRQSKLDADTEFFLTRMTFPHLTSQDTARLISLPAEGTQKTDILVQFEDYMGNTLNVRKPASPKEIARLHKLFTIERLPVEFGPEHQYLVVLNDRLQVIGGLFYRFGEENQVHIEKIVVDSTYRRRGISGGLLKEFFNRVRTQGAEIATVGFLRPQFFYRFGFEINRKYGNMVKKLTDDQQSDEPHKATDLMQA